MKRLAVALLTCLSALSCLLLTAAWASTFFKSHAWTRLAAVRGSATQTARVDYWMINTAAGRLLIAHWGEAIPPPGQVSATKTVWNQVVSPAAESSGFPGDPRYFAIYRFTRTNTANTYMLDTGVRLWPPVLLTAILPALALRRFLRSGHGLERGFAIVTRDAPPVTRDDRGDDAANTVRSTAAQ